jgi:RNase H-fold protein (predicted Holliday junction resolvase)/tRNA1(Val) A37 N6-methylase TrmN6
MDAERAALFEYYGNDASRFYNMWPLYIAVYKMAIKLIMLMNEKRLNQGTYNDYEKSLSTINLGSPRLMMDQKKETMTTLIHRLWSAMKMDAVVQKDLDDERNETQAARLSVLTGKGGNKSRKKSNKKSKTLKYSKSRKDVATAIKDIPLSKARADFAALKAVPCHDINQAAKVGNAAMDHYFFRHRLASKTKRHISYYDWIRTDWQRNESEHRFYKFNLAQGKTPDKARYAVFRLYYGAIHGFKPLVAKWMYCTYKPRIAVLDFSAGWGGRCLGAMALGIPYIGIDTNVDLRPAYERMIKELDPSSLRAAVSMHFQDSAATDFAKFRYDMVFTSPPYFKTVKPIEGYAHMPDYNDRADFNARFLFPVIRNSYAHLSRGGTYALNIPDDMCDEIRAAGILPARLLAKHRLFLQPRFAKGNPNHPDMQYKEHIYVWKKP